MRIPHQAFFRRDRLGANVRRHRKQEQPLITIYHNPRRGRRPIVVNGNRVALGRPPENVLGIL